ncbi:hypothetical protein BH09MYX1_BH09MYX1_06060 [soil metagenome]
MSTSATLPARDLKNDNKGAIMVMGIFFACAMIGLTWEFIGLGDAMIWRDRSQEVADSIAFSSASVHARAMNFIAFLNIIMLIMTTIYLIMAIIFNLLDFTLVVVGTTKKHWFVKRCTWHRIEVSVIGALLSEVGGEVLIELASYFCDIAEFVQPIHDPLKTAIEKYQNNFMGPIMPKLAKAQTFIAEAAPFAAALTGSIIGYKYQDWGKHHLGTALSASMVPGNTLNIEKWTYDNKEFTAKDERIGLPVEEKKMGELCGIGAKLAADAFADKIGMPGFMSKVFDWLVGMVTKQIQKFYCSKGATGAFPTALETGIYWAFGGGPGWGVKAQHPYDFKADGKEFWEDTGGPKHMVKYASNGNDWLQTYGFVAGSNRVERSEKIVAAHGFQFSKTNTDTGFALYFAQAEYYSDCNDTWEKADCNKDEHAMYSLNWRTRLRRVHYLSWGKSIFDRYMGTTFGDGFNKGVGAMVKDTAIFQTVSAGLKGLFGGMGAKGADLAVDKGIKFANKQAGSYVGGMLSNQSLDIEIIH